MITVNPSTRQFTIPGSDLVFGVTADSGSEVKHFQCPRYVGNNVDIASSFVRINFRNANGDTDFYIVDELTVNGDNVTFNWMLSPKVTSHKGQVKFVMCVVGPDLKLKWHTTQGTGQVMDGLEPDNSHVEDQTADIVAQLIALVEAQTDAVEKVGAEQMAAVNAAAKAAQDSAVAQIEAKRTNSLASIPADYTAVQNAVRGAANAIRGKVSGGVIRVDDVSPMEHYPVVKVHGKNLLPYPYKQTTSTTEGGTFTALQDGGVQASGTPTGYTSINIYEGTPLVKTGKAVLSYSGDFENISLAIAIYDSGANLLFSSETWMVSSPILLNADMYQSAARWIIYIKRGTVNIPMRGIAYPQVELGEVATEYAPYIDPTTVKVRACGKNLLTFPYFDGQQVTRGGITGTANADGSVRLVGTATENFYFRLAQIPLGSTTIISERTDGIFYLRDCAYDAANKFSFCMVYKGETVNKTFYPQIEVGTVGTAYEPPLGAAIEVTPSKDGVVSGVRSVSPTMTLLTNTPGVIINCEYSRDTNKVIADILNKIATLGG